MPSPRVRARLAVASRVLAALAGGYALAAGFTSTVALLVGSPREEAALVGAVPSFLILTGAIVWAAAAPSATRAWLGIGAPAILLGLATWWLRSAAA